MESVVSTSSNTLKVVTHNQYHNHERITPATVPLSPFEMFRTWLTSVQGVVPEPEAMSVSTATASGIPSSRFVLLKQLDKRGFVFFTNYNSRKSKELQENPHAALAWYWKEVHRQVRVVGRVEKVSKDESKEYFNSRPVGSRIGAWASEQSKVVDEEELSSKLEEVQARLGVDQSQSEAEVPLPEFWGGWRVLPEYVDIPDILGFATDGYTSSEIEFWAGKPSRLHDRIRYSRVPGSPDDAPRWVIERLAP